MINLLEMAYYSTNDHVITKEVLLTINTKPVMYIDKMTLIIMIQLVHYKIYSW